MPNEILFDQASHAYSELPAEVAQTRLVEGRHYDEVFVRLQLPAGQKPAIDRYLSQLEQQLGMKIMRALAFVSASEIAQLTRSRHPLVFVANQHDARDAQPAVEVYGIAPRPGANLQVRELSRHAHVIESVEGDCRVRRLFYASAQHLGRSFRESAEAAFEDIEDVLDRASLRPRHITRTWFFIRDIESQYEDFNAVRNHYFDAWRISAFPASTGIGATLRPAEHLGVMFEAVSRDGENPVEPFDSSLQCSPAAYGVRFSRANRFVLNGCRHVNISGISSIDQRGDSLCGGQVADAVEYAMRSLEDLLATGGMSYQDVCSSYVYVKDQAVHAALDAYLAQSQASFPYLINYADICRPDLVFEIEAKAIARAWPTDHGCSAAGEP